MKKHTHLCYSSKRSHINENFDFAFSNSLKEEEKVVEEKRFDEPIIKDKAKGKKSKAAAKEGPGNKLTFILIRSKLN